MISCSLFTSGAIVGSANLLGLGITLLSGTHLVTDLLGSGAFAVSAVASGLIGGGGGTRALISTVLITAWSIRLAGFLFYRSPLCCPFESTCGMWP